MTARRRWVAVGPGCGERLVKLRPEVQAEVDRLVAAAVDGPSPAKPVGVGRRPATQGPYAASR